MTDEELAKDLAARCKENLILKPGETFTKDEEALVALLISAICEAVVSYLRRMERLT